MVLTKAKLEGDLNHPMKKLVIVSKELELFKEIKAIPIHTLCVLKILVK